MYRHPTDAETGAPIRQLIPPNTWVSIEEDIAYGGRTWARINPDEYVQADRLIPAAPSSFHGVLVEEQSRGYVAFVVAELLNVRAAPGTDEDNPPIAQLPRYSVVQVYDQQVVDGEAWYRIGERQWVLGQHVRVVVPVRVPDGVGPDEKWISVNLDQQTVAAYEGRRMVYATLTSTGLPWWPTVEGLFRVWAKLRTGKMSGGSLEWGDYYYLEDVPWILYFYRGYGVHGAYWHDGFGYPRSHGCVNLSPLDARWFFDWAGPAIPENRRAILSTEENRGTWVYVHRTPPRFDEPRLTRVHGDII